MTVPNRQRMQIRQHLTDEAGPFSPQIRPAQPGVCIATVEIIDGLAVQASDPAIFRALGAACELAARSIEGAQETAA